MFSGREGGKRDMRFSGRTSRENKEGKTDGQTDRGRWVSVFLIGACLPFFHPIINPQTLSGMYDI